MRQPFKVSFESPQSGWMSVRLSVGEQNLLLAASYAPYDSLRDLIAGLSSLLTGSTELTVRWNCEPEEYDFKMVTEGDQVRFDVIRYPDHQRIQGTSQVVFSLQGSKLDTCLPFWKELRDLHRRSSTDVFDKNWRRKFPQHEMQRFTKLIRSLKRAANSGASGPVR